MPKYIHLLQQLVRQPRSPEIVDVFKLHIFDMQRKEIMTFLRLSANILSEVIGLPEVDLVRRPKELPLRQEHHFRSCRQGGTPRSIEDHCLFRRERGRCHRRLAISIRLSTTTGKT